MSDAIDLTKILLKKMLFVLKKLLKKNTNFIFNYF